MKQGDKAAFSELLSAVFDYYGRSLSAAVLEIYWNGLELYGLHELREAFSRHAKNPDTGQFAPKIADVVKMLGGSTKDSAHVALSVLESAFDDVGAYKSPVFDDALIHVVVAEMGGWVELCAIEEKNWEFRRNEFMARYRAWKARGVVPAYPARLLGIADGANAAAGYFPDGARLLPEENVVLVGDARKAHAVMTKGVDRLSQPNSIPLLAFLPEDPTKKPPKFSAPEAP